MTLNFTTTFLASIAIMQPSLSAFVENKEIRFEDMDEKELSLMYPSKHQTVEDFFNNGIAAFSAGKTDQAIDLFLKAIKANGNSPQPYFNLGIAYEAKGQKDKAIEAYKDAILHKLDYPRAHLQLAKALQQSGDLEQAITHYQQAVRYDPTLIDAAMTIARLLVDKERFKSAAPYFALAVKARPSDVQLRFEYANTLNTINETEKALEEYLQLLTMKPNDTGILYNTAYTYKKLGRIDESMPYYEKTLQLKPDHAEAHFSLGLTYLINGDFKRGWSEYEWRWNRNSQMKPREFKQPLWDGSPLNGKIIFIHAEQGLGDTFQFIRYAQIVKEKYKGTIVVAVQKPLQTVIGRCCPYIDRVITLDYMPQNFDYHIPLMSLPFLLNTEQHTIPGTAGYITPDPTLVAHWKEKLSHDKNLKVGICWQGNSNYSTPFLRTVVAAKSFSVNKFAPLSEIPGVTLYSLQRETGVEQLQSVSRALKLVTFDDTFDSQHGRFMDTAAVMKNLDLIISVDTSICHLAGALGVPVWVMIPEPPDWRWMLQRTDSPWYPRNMRLFRQQTVGDWDAVIQAIAQELKNVVTKKVPIIQPVIAPTKAAPDIKVISLDPDNLSAKINALCSTLSQEKASPDNPTFMNTLRAIYLLDSMKGIKS